MPRSIAASQAPQSLPADFASDSQIPTCWGEPSLTMTADQSPALGYSVVQAESIDEAVALLAACPMDMWVYEAMPM